MYTGVCIDMCVGMCIDMCIDVCADMRVGMPCRCGGLAQKAHCRPRFGTYYTSTHHRTRRLPTHPVSYGPT